MARLITRSIAVAWSSAKLCRQLLTTSASPDGTDSKKSPATRSTRSARPGAKVPRAVPITSGRSNSTPVHRGMPSQDGGQQGTRAAADVDHRAVTTEVVRVGDLGDGLRVEADRRRGEQAGL